MNIIDKHGISVGTEQINNNIYILLRPVGKLTHSDYMLAEPILNLALSQVNESTTTKVLVDERGMTGMDIRAKLDNLKLEFKQGKKLDKVAVLGAEKSEKSKSKIEGWLVSGDVEYFDSELKAVTWLLS